MFPKGGRPQLTVLHKHPALDCPVLDGKYESGVSKKQLTIIDVTFCGTKYRETRYVAMLEGITKRGDATSEVEEIVQRVIIYWLRFC